MRVRWVEDGTERWKIEAELTKRFGQNYTKEQVDSVAEELDIAKRLTREGEVVGCVAIGKDSFFVVRTDEIFFETIKAKECTAL